MTWYFDIANLLVCLISITIAWRIKIIPSWISIILAIQFFLPFILNDFLFPSTYMKDQYAYWHALQDSRSFNFIPDEIKLNERFQFIFKKIILTSWFLSILPLPFVETIKSLGFFNRFLFLVLFLWIYNKNFLNGLPLFFILFYPSLLLYSSLGLRDPIILMFMLIGTIFLIECKYIRFFLAIIPLYFIKFQNFLLMILMYLIIFIYKKQKSGIRGYLIITSFVFICLIPFIDNIIDILEHYRNGFWFENRAKIDDLSAYKPLEGIFSLMTNGIIGLISVLFRPFLWESSNIFQIIQSLENILVFLFLIFFTKKAYNQNILVTNRWVIFLVIALTIHGLVVFNLGTISRYKFTFIVMFVVGLSYELFKVNRYRFPTILKKN